MTTLSISPEQENQRQLKEDASKAYDLLEELRRNLGQLFLHAAGEKKLHDRYIDQRELNTKGYAEKVDNILKRYPSKSSLGKLISTIIHTHKIATGIKSERIDNDEVYTIAHSIALHQATEDKKNIEVITKLLNQMGVTQGGVDRLISDSLKREIKNQRMNNANSKKSKSPKK